MDVSPEEAHALSVLLDLYEGLLPKRQRQVLALRLDEDLSLAEMAERLSVSRQACEDALRRGEKALLDFEQKVGFHRWQLREKERLRELESVLSSMTSDNWDEKRAEALRHVRAGEF